MKKINAPIKPSALAVGLLEDNGRALFLLRALPSGIQTIELPCVLLSPGENPVARLTDAFRQQTGIDAQVHEILFEKRHNAGSRKKKAWIPALVFKITAKNASAKPSSGFSGYKWIASNDLPKYRLAKNAEWLR
ncbi:MAG: hypothetical protein QW568_05350 [Candidatus Anstonellaceae archaeon]